MKSCAWKLDVNPEKEYKILNEKLQGRDLDKQMQGRNYSHIKDFGFELMTLGKCSLWLEKPLSETRSLFVESLRWLRTGIDYGEFISPREFMDILSLAIVCGDSEARSYFSSFDRDRFRHPKVASPDLEFDLGESLSAVSRGENIPAILMGRLKKHGTKLRMRSDQEYFNLISEILLSLEEKSSADFGASMTTRAMTLGKYFDVHAKSNQHTSGHTLLDLIMSATWVLGKERKMEWSSSTSLVPPEVMSLAFGTQRGPQKNA